MPSPVKERPGLVIRDPFHYSDATLIVPPALVQTLAFFDGEHSALDLKAYLVEATGELDVRELQNGLETALSDAGFLENDVFARKKEEAETEFRNTAFRLPAHSGSGYPDEPAELKEVLNEYLGTEVDSPQGKTRAIVAPHVSPFGGIEAYRAAYRGLRQEDADRTFLILGTSHYGQPDVLGLTRKPFLTPFGEARTDRALVDEIEEKCGSAVVEDYCHSVEHSIEFQVVFLQHLFGPDVKIVPVLCGPYTSVYTGGFPENNDKVKRMIGGLGEIAARRADLVWVLGVDMAHMGQRYGDPIQARAGLGDMQRVEARDRARIERMTQGDGAGFWQLVRENQDDLKWCGSAPIYTFLQAVPEARGTLRHYQQWNIDESSVVSFAGIRFL